MYQVAVFLHILGAVVFALGHGTAIAVAFRLKKESEHPRIAALLDVSSWSTSIMYVGLLLIVVPGVVLGFMGDYWGQWWLWVSIGLLVVLMGAMYGMAAPYYMRVRAATGATMRADAVDPARARAALASLATSTLPVRLALVGGVGLVVILWLMVAKPG